MKIIDGKMVSDLRRESLRTRVSTWKAAKGVAPGLAVILVGNDPASEVYVRNKAISCEKAGMVSTIHRMDENTKIEALYEKITLLNQAVDVHGILVQLPLPADLDESLVLSYIDPKKDVDCLTTENVGLFWSGRARVGPCTPSGVMALLEHYEIPVAGQKAVVIGRSHIVGLPMVQLLQKANATVTLCHSKTQDLRSHTRDADILVVAAGQPEFIGKEDIKAGATVIDVGIHRKELSDGKTKLCGDVRMSELENWAYAVTPVPKGVGPMTITMLLENTLTLAQLAQSK